MHRRWRQVINRNQRRLLPVVPALAGLHGWRSLAWACPTPVYSIRSVPKASSPDDNALTQVVVGQKGFPAISLVRDPMLLERAGDRVEKQLVLVRMCSCMGTGAFVPRVHVLYIAAGAPHR